MDNYRIFGQNAIISNDSRETGLNNNDLIIGQSGSAKTGSYVSPNLQVINHSLIVTDTKRQLYYDYGYSLTERGFKVMMIDFKEPYCSLNAYNPLRFVRRNSDGSFREQDIITIAKSLVPILDKNEPFWEQAARSFVSCMIGYVLEFTPEENHNMVGVMKAYQDYNNPEKRMKFDMTLLEHPDSFYARRYVQMNSSQKAEKMWASIQAFVAEALNPFDAAEYHYLLGNNCMDQVDFDSLGRQRTVLFLNVSDSDRTFDPIVNLLYTQAFQVLIREADMSRDGRLHIPVRFILDDFATNTTIPDFDKLISVIRSREIYVSIILQCKSQLESIYNTAVANTIANNCDHTLYLGGHDRETAEYVAINADDSIENVLTMPRDQAYLIETGTRARVIRKITPYSKVKARSDADGNEPEA